MRYVRLKADDAGESHFEQATLDLNEADYRPPAPLLCIAQLPSGWFAIHQATLALDWRVNPSAKGAVFNLLKGPSRGDSERRT